MRTHYGNQRSSESTDQSIVGHVTFAAGYVTRYLEDYSRRCALSSVDLAHGVASLVLASTGGEVLGADHPVQMRGTPAFGDEAAPKMALAGSARSDPAPAVKIIRRKSHKGIIRWSEEDNRLLLDEVRRNGQLAAPELARKLRKALGRSEGAIRQRISRLTAQGVFQVQLARDGKNPPFQVLRLADKLEALAS